VENVDELLNSPTTSRPHKGGSLTGVALHRFGIGICALTVSSPTAISSWQVLAPHPGIFGRLWQSRLHEKEPQECVPEALMKQQSQCC
jgi:hypothetical protein